MFEVRELSDKISKEGDPVLLETTAYLDRPFLWEYMRPYYPFRIISPRSFVHGTIAECEASITVIQFAYGQLVGLPIYGGLAY